MSETFYQKQIYTAKAKSLLTIDFSNFYPNYFRVVNMGSGELFFSATTSPTTSRFDMKIAPQGSKMHVEPYGRSTVYVFNNGATDTDFAMLSFNAEFEPLALAVLSDESLAEVIMSQKDYDGIIRGFNIPLPSGSNTIGAVNLNSNTQLTAIKNAVDSVITAVKANTPKDTVNIATNAQLSEIKTALDTLNNKDFSGGSADIEDNLTELNANLRLLSGYYGQYHAERTATSSTTNNITGLVGGFTFGSGLYPSLVRVLFFANDSDYDIKIQAQRRGSDTYEQIITIKSGEVLNNFPIYCNYGQGFGWSYMALVAYKDGVATDDLIVPFRFHYQWKY